MRAPLGSARWDRDVFGLTEWFRFGEHERVETGLHNIVSLGARSLRTHLSWADFHREKGAEWYDWLIPKIAGQVDLLPCVHYTPPSLSVTGATSGPPKRLADFSEFIEQVLERYGRYFSHIELWNEPNNLLDWDWRVDPGWNMFSEMVGAAVRAAEARGWRTVLGGPCPFDPNWLNTMGQRGLLREVSAVGIHGFPGTWDSENGIWGGWIAHIGELQRLLERHDSAAEIWITEAGYSTWRHDELEQARRFIEALDAPAARLYWYALADLTPDVEVQEGRQFDLRHYHVGVLDLRGRDKLIARLLRAGGVPAIRRKLRLVRTRSAASSRPVLITGGGGFIGSNLADALLSSGEEVIVFDNFSRFGAVANADWLRSRHGERVIFRTADLRDANAIADAVDSAASVIHLAGQVAVTESLDSPLEDFTINAAGTLHLLEALRRKSVRTPLIFASTNKVYGSLAEVALEALPEGYAPLDPAIRANGIDERQPLDFCTPYGCSKGAAEQYVRDYARTFGLSTVVMRMSCVYGPRQFGTEDQGWIAHFLIQALAGAPLTIYGDGLQVRDAVHVADAVRAYRMVLARIDRLSGQAFNLGGGPDNAVSLLAMLAEAEALLGWPVHRSFAPARPGDQLYFVSDTRRLTAATGWRATIPWRDGVGDLLDWLQDNCELVGLPPAGMRRSEPA